MGKAKSHLDKLAARRRAYEAALESLQQGYLNYLAENISQILEELARLQSTLKGKAGEAVGRRCAELGFGRGGSARTAARVLNVKRALDEGVITLGELQAALRAGHGLSTIGMLLTRGRSGERLTREKILEAFGSKKAMELQLRAAGRYARESKRKT